MTNMINYEDIEFNDVFDNTNFLVADDAYYFLFTYLDEVLYFINKYDYIYLIGRAGNNWYVLDEDLRFKDKLREPLFMNNDLDIILCDDMGASSQLKIAIYHESLMDVESNLTQTT